MYRYTLQTPTGEGAFSFLSPVRLAALSTGALFHAGIALLEGSGAEMSNVQAAGRVVSVIGNTPRGVRIPTPTTNKRTR